MANRRWLMWDRWMRGLHLYTGMFLLPWMTVYAVSAFCLNHKTWFNEGLQLATKWEVVREMEFSPGADAPREPAQQAKAILEHVNLAGAHSFSGSFDSGQMALYRWCARGHYRITWRREPPRIVIEQQRPFSLYSLVNALHFQHAYYPFFAYWAWAAVVDATTISTIIWVVSGVYLWARRLRRRFLGGLVMAAGILVFAGLAVLLCR